jgi:hypothetical protein
VFAEAAGNVWDLPVERVARPPYLAICLVGRPSADTPVAILRVYAHPCISARDLMLVDSNLERRTFAELLSLQSWLREHKGVRIEIEKPHFDLVEGNGPDPEPAPRKPCIPDFIVRAEGDAVRSGPKVLVETMGFADETYRARKSVTHELMTRVAGAPVVLHDFHFPAASTQVARDRRFWLDARWAPHSAG